MVNADTLPIVDGSMIAEIDQAIIQRQSISHDALMEEAAQACCAWIAHVVPRTQAIVICCGPGNNGGDGLAIARRLFMAGYTVRVYADASAPHTLQHRQYQRTAALMAIMPLADLRVDDALWVIDALFGVGVRGALRAPYRHYAAQINASSATVIAIDTPSGLGDTLSDMAGVVHATHTLSLCCVKNSQLWAAHESAVGTLHLLPLASAARSLDAYDDQPQWLSAAWFQGALPARRAFAHKGAHGRVALCAGSEGMLGAAILSAKACLRAGVGLLRVHCDAADAAQALHSAVPEAMYASLLPESAYILAIGPGWGQAQQRHQQLADLLALPTHARVIDADALNILALHPDWLVNLPERTVLTPHPGEFARLTGLPIAAGASRITLAQAYAQRWRVTIVLKGRYSVIAAANGRVWINSSGNSGLAKGGSGDVLTGVIAALLAQGLCAEHAAAAGVYWHGCAADMASQSIAPRALLASDVVAHLGMC